MIRTTTTIKASRISRGDIPEQLERVTRLVSEAHDSGYLHGIQVQFAGAFTRTAPATQDRIDAKVVVTK